MTTRTKPTRARSASIADDRDAEAQATWASPVFQALLAEAREAKPADLVSPEELDRRLGSTTPAQAAHADAFLDAIEHLAQEQGADVTEEQSQVLELVLTGLDFARRDGSLDRLAEDSGLSAESIRAVGAALTAALARTSQDLLARR